MKKNILQSDTALYTSVSINIFSSTCPNAETELMRRIRTKLLILFHHILEYKLSCTLSIMPYKNEKKKKKTKSVFHIDETLMPPLQDYFCNRSRSFFFSFIFWGSLFFLNLTQMFIIFESNGQSFLWKNSWEIVKHQQFLKVKTY